MKRDYLSLPPRADLMGRLAVPKSKKIMNHLSSMESPTPFVQRRDEPVRTRGFEINSIPVQQPFAKGDQQY